MAEPLKIVGYDPQSVVVAPNEPDVVSVSFFLSREATGVEQGIASRYAKIGHFFDESVWATGLSPANMKAEINTLNNVLDEAELQAEAIAKAMTDSESKAIIELSLFDFNT